MPRIRLFHWKAVEAKPLIAQLRAEGYTVDYSGEDHLARHFPALRESPPHAIVIDLSRLPSHGRHVAVALRAQKKIRSIPIVFVDGDPEKVKKIRADFPDAIHTSRAKLGSALKRAKPVADPVSPPSSTRTVAQKLGIRSAVRVAVIDAPRGYAKSIGPLPAGAALEEESAETLPVTLWFVREAVEFLDALPRMRDLAGSSRLWVVYPKQQAKPKAPGEVTLDFIRNEAMAAGLVHRAICSVDATWTAMLFGPRK
jgi:hypothetical protein